MQRDFPGDETKFEHLYNFNRRSAAGRGIYAACQLVIATTPPQLDFLVQNYGTPCGKRSA